MQLESECARGVWLPVAASRHVVLQQLPKGAPVDGMWYEVAEVREDAGLRSQPGHPVLGQCVLCRKWPVLVLACLACCCCPPSISLFPACPLPDLVPRCSWQTAIWRR